MSTTDRIDRELTALQNELGQLKSYTDDIGRARDASAKVLRASEHFVSAFQEHIKGLVDTMERGAADFQQTCTSSSEQLHKASVRFDSDIDRSQKLLDVLGKQLDATAVRVEQMTGEIRQMDIPGRFSVVGQDIRSAEGRLIALDKGLASDLQRLETKHDELVKRNKMQFIVGVVVAAVTLVLIAFVAFR